MRDQLRIWLALAMIAVALFVFATVFGHPITNSRPLVPALVPVFGTPFGILFAALQVAYCGVYGIRKGFVLLPIMWAIAVLLAFALFGRALEPDALAMPRADRAVTGAACASALVLGFGVWHGKL